MAKTRAKTRADLEDDLRQAVRRNADLRRELDEARDLIQRQDEQLQDVEALIEDWKQGFEMSLDANTGIWEWPAFLEELQDYHDRYFALLRDWNKNVTLFNNTVVKRNVGRPLSASEGRRRRRSWRSSYGRGEPAQS